MRILCPECASGFDVPDNAITAKGRKLKCSQCEHKWHQMPVEAAPAPKPVADDDTGSDMQPVDDPEPDGDSEIDFGGDDPADDEDKDEASFSMFGTGQGDPDEVDDFDEPPIPGRRSMAGRGAAPSRKGRIIAIAAAVVFLLVIPGAMIGARAPLVNAIPAFSPLFDAIGLHVAVPGEHLIIQNVGAWRKTEGGVERMLIQGEIHNDTQMLQSVPVLRAVIKDVAGTPLQSAPYTPEAAILVPGDTLTFGYEIPNPGPNAAQVTVSFSGEERQGGFGY